MSSLMRSRSAARPSTVTCDEPWVDPVELVASSADADRLFRTVENEIIPRLVLLHRRDEAPSRAEPGPRSAVRLGHAEVSEFTTLILKGHEAALAYITDLADCGTGVDTLCLDLLGPCARRLGELWNDDLVDFTEVTIGLGRLQALLRGLSTSKVRASLAAEAGHRALFAYVQGEQHTFGLAMVCDFFRTAGWSVWGDSPSGTREVLRLVHDHPFDLIGFSIGNERSIDTLADLIRSVRCESKRAGVGILVGGPLLQHHPDLAHLVGADATASDARQAILAAQRLAATRNEGR